MSSLNQPSDVLNLLQQAVDGLLFPSETDTPFKTFFWPGDSRILLTPNYVRRLAGADAREQVKSVPLKSFFRSATKAEEWHNAEEKAETERFQNLVKTIQANLADVKVFQIGEAKKSIYIIGRVEGGWAGLQTQIVET